MCEVYASAFGVVLTFTEERAVFAREQEAKLYSVLWYFVGKTMVDLPLLALNTTVFSVLVYSACGFQAGASHFARFAMLLALTAMCGQALGLVVAAAVPDRATAVLLAPMSVSLLVLFTPYSVQASSIPLYMRWLKAISPFWHGFEGLSVNEFTDLALRCTEQQGITVPVTADSLETVTLCRLGKGEEVLASYSMAASFEVVVGWLLLLAVGYRVLALLTLVYAASPSKPPAVQPLTAEVRAMLLAHDLRHAAARAASTKEPVGIKHAAEELDGRDAALWTDKVPVLLSSYF